MYWIITTITFFIYATAILVHFNVTKNKKQEDLVFAMAGGFLASIFWFVTLPFIIIIACAWAASRAILAIIKVVKRHE
jgi:arginine exporter protein ArgO